MTADLLARLVATVDEAEREARFLLAHRSDADVRTLAEAMLRRVAADRRTIERHTPVDRTRWGWSPGVYCEYCDELCHSESGLGCLTPFDAPWPCPDVRDLAGGYGVEVGS